MTSPAPLDSSAIRVTRPRAATEPTGPPEQADPRHLPPLRPLLVFAGSYLVLMVLAPMLTPASFMPPALMGPALYAVLAVIGAWALRDILMSALRTVIARPLRTLGATLLGLVLAVAAMVAGSALLSLVAAATGIAPGLANDDAVSSSLSRLAPAVALLTFGLIGPVVEELVFRVVVLRAAARCLPVAAAVLVSGVLFGLVHVHTLSPSEVITVIPHACLGVALGALAWRYGIIVPIIVHVLINLSGLLPTVLGA